VADVGLNGGDEKLSSANLGILAASGSVLDVVHEAVDGVIGPDLKDEVGACWKLTCVAAAVISGLAGDHL